jgi:hypothetical protein
LRAGSVYSGSSVYMDWVKGLQVRPHRRREKRRRLGVLVGATRWVAQAGGEECFTLDLLDLDAGEPTPARIRLDFFGHGLAISPGRPREAVLLEKRGRGGCAVDLAERRVVRPITPMGGHVFYGHGAYSRAGDVVFVVEARVESHEGAISIRDSSTFTVLGTLPTYGMAPHDCHLVEGGKTLVVTNGGGPVGSPFLPSVTFVDVATRALLEKHKVLHGDCNIGHVAVADDREFAAVSAPRDGLPPKTSLGGVTLRKRGERSVHMMAPEAVTSRLLGESLSVAIHTPSRTAVATHPDADVVTFWSLDAGGLTTMLELPGPRGVTMTLDQQFYAISHGADARLLLVEARSFRARAERRLGAGIFGGAHLYTWTSCPAGWSCGHQ